MIRLAVFLATFGYLGHFPVAPGTAGSAAGVVVYILLGKMGLVWVELPLIVALYLVGIWAATLSERYFGRPDPGPVVIDEVMGMLLTVAFTPVGLSGLLTGFVLFRIFDVVKPWPTGRFERLPRGIGVMSDDAMAGLYANAVLRLISWWFPGLTS
jgi:phosphatidylglycerophosphatase A